MTAIAQITPETWLPWRKAADLRGLPHSLVHGWMGEGVLPYSQPIRDIVVKNATA